ncbi:MAG: DUF4230 domain-containing protein [Bacteroidia bacterium]|nr:DUF4230 domain-containing protein [Bacteroidia bacterium]NNF31700.1 DUF4230 domain-containing protein [Flavobacteriaceae bacterium]NNJ81559.1 DUF4230 domain-containing protein [Flavobacteriaceae bacterium]NNK55214.1 DUF4230 domain-containing protein [Flavobacteriaceae bacterium]NNM10209.1 DUF4230 domain-containing protein [Flavobacteriaceae bacterium]
MELLFLGLAVGAIVAYFVFVRFNTSRRKRKSHAQSIVLMERIRTVCKLITVEGDFSEIYHYENLKSKWVNLLLGKKKALVVIEAKAYVGFDLSQLKMDADVPTRTVRLSNFPKPKLMTVETDFKYYDKKNGWANPFTASDLTEINKEAKNHIVEKVPGSGLLEEASKHALETVELIEKLVETINWKLDYSDLLLDEKDPKSLSETDEES